MGIEVIRTPDGNKLRDTQTGKLAGSLPSKPTLPTVSTVNHPEAKQQQSAKGDNINEKYDKYSRSQEETRLNTLFDSLALDDSIVIHYAQFLYEGPFTQGFPIPYIEGKIRQALGKYRKAHPDNSEGQIAYYNEFADIIIETIQGPDEVEQVHLSEDEIRYRILSSLNQYGVNLKELDKLIDLDKVANAMDLIDSSKLEYQTELNKLYLTKVDKSQYIDRAVKGFQLLGLDPARIDTLVNDWLNLLPESPF